MKLEAKRAEIRDVSPQLDGGRYPIKRVIGENVPVTAEVLSDGQDALSVMLKYRHRDDNKWLEVPMAEIEADRWKALFTVTRLGRYEYTVEAWKNPLRTWWLRLRGRIGTAGATARDMAAGLRLLEGAAAYAPREDANALKRIAETLQASDGITRMVRDAPAAEEFDQLLNRNGPRTGAAEYTPHLSVVVDPVLVRFGAWYQLFPRSCGFEPGRHGTLQDLIRRLPVIAEMGFDVLCLTPIHPIGKTARKGRNNSTSSQPGDPGSPWAVGSEDGGHKSVHPELGTLEDFRLLLSQARRLGMEVALDVALQCSPDHPYVHDHPDWFRRDLDGNFECGEDPPNRYEDVYPFDFESADLWAELMSIFVFWIEQGVRVFRVDNPHTKPFEFWESLIAYIEDQWPDTIFLAEGLTRPRPMAHLARIGFSLSYDYFPWRNSKGELTEYYSSLSQAESKQYFRPCLWPNTPQHLPAFLQYGGRAAFMIRFILAATLGASYGIYGPAFELFENRAVDRLGSVDYRDSEQYELKTWDWGRAGNLRKFVGLVNRIRRSNIALQSNENLHFHFARNDQIIAFTKADPTRTNVMLTVVNLDPDHVQADWLTLRLDAIGIDPAIPYAAHDLLTGAKYRWQGERNYVSLDPADVPAHVLRLERE